MTLSFAQADRDAVAQGDHDAALVDDVVIADTATPVTTTNLPYLPPNHRAALEYIKRGWRIFPIFEMLAGDCSCPPGHPSREGGACKSPGKHPRTGRGHTEATTDSKQIDTWWALEPDSNVGIATGNGLIVLDIDPKNGGGESLKTLLAGAEPWQTPTVQTGSGGLHFYFRNQGEFRNKAGFHKLPGIDVRGDGGYVVAPPSNHESGNHYEWIVGPDSAMTAWPWPDDDKQAQPIADPVDDMIPEGQRNAALASLAGTFRRRGMDADEIEAALSVVNERRCNPPLPASEISAIAKSVSRYQPEQRFTETRNARREFPTNEPMSHRSTDFLNIEVKPPSWLIRGIWPEHAVGFVSGPPKSFKSFLTLELAYAIATGRPFLDQHEVESPKTVLLIQAESDFGSFKDRVRRCRDHYGDAPGLYIISNKPLYLDDDVDVDRLRAELRATQPDLVMFDPMASFHKSNENDTQSMQGFIRTIRELRDEFESSMLVVHHWSKTPPGEKMLRGGERMRGNSSLYGAAEAHIQMRRVSDDVNRSVVKVELKEWASPDEFTVQFDPDTSALQIVTTSGILFGTNEPSKPPYWQKDGD